MKSLSLCMIVKNEEKTLDRVLQNASIYADEIIIVDTGSTDKTKEIALNWTEKVYDFVWEDDFAKARNYSFDKAKSDYIIWLDGDDFLPDDIACKIKQWKEGASDEDVLMCSYALTYDKNFLPSFLFLRERIVKNLPCFRWHDRVHEVIIPSGVVVCRKDIIIYHGKQKPYTNRNLKIYQKMIREGQSLSPRGKFYYARELFYNGFYKKSIKMMDEFLGEKDGFIENKIDACLIKSYCYECLGSNEKALESLLFSFKLSPPKGEIAYNIGRLLTNQKEFHSAIFWLEMALKSGDDLESGAFVDKTKISLSPALELVVCYYNLGNFEKAQYYHQLARSIAPNDSSVLFNEKFFHKTDKKG